MSDISVSDTTFDDPFYSSPQDEKTNPTDTKTALFVLSVMGLLAGGSYVCKKRFTATPGNSPTPTPPVDAFTPVAPEVPPRPASPPPEEASPSPSPALSDGLSQVSLFSASSRDELLGHSPPPDEEAEAPAAAGIKPKPLPTCTVKEIQTVEWIFKTVATETIGLLGKANKLLEQQKTIDHLHPFTLFVNVSPTYVQQIFASLISRKKNDMMKGITDSMLREYTNDNLFHFVKALADQMKKDPAKIENFIKTQNWTAGKQDWTAFVKYLFDVK